MSENRQGPSHDVGSAETHVGAIFFVGDRAYKLKKPVDLGFLDFRDRATRHRIVHREYELNRRLSPDVYLGVVDIGEEGGSPCDHALVMRRMPAERALSTLVEAGEDVDRPVHEVARTLAGFHSCAERGDDIDAEGTAEAVRGRWHDNLDGLRPFAGELLDGAELDEIARRGEEFLSGREPLLHRRRREERIVDGHGDLLADDIFCLDDGPRILDCLEFDDRLRWLDALDDAACLAMDLEHRGDGDLAQRFLDWYSQFGNDTAPLALRHFYTAYRALVRAKVACLKHTPGDSDNADDARSHVALALDHVRSAAVRLIMVGGPPGSGKTTLAGAIADELGAALCSSDRIRKELAGMSPGESAADDYGHGLYGPEHTERTYEELNRRAGELLAQGETVVVDASWSRQAHRDAMLGTAESLRSEAVALRCAASPEELAARVQGRTGSVSDADASVARRMADDADPWPQAHTVPTDVSADDSAHRAFAILTGRE